MSDDGHRELLHVLGRHERLAVEQRERLGGADEGEGGPGLAPSCTPGAVRVARTRSTA